MLGRNGGVELKAIRSLWKPRGANQVQTSQEPSSECASGTRAMRRYGRRPQAVSRSDGAAVCTCSVTALQHEPTREVVQEPSQPSEQSEPPQRPQEPQQQQHWQQHGCGTVSVSSICSPSDAPPATSLPVADRSPPPSTHALQPSVPPLAQQLLALPEAPSASVADPAHTLKVATTATTTTVTTTKRHGRRPSCSHVRELVSHGAADGAYFQEESGKLRKEGEIVGLDVAREHLSIMRAGTIACLGEAPSRMMGVGGQARRRGRGVLDATQTINVQGRYQESLAAASGALALLPPREQRRQRRQRRLDATQPPPMRWWVLLFVWATPLGYACALHRVLLLQWERALPQLLIVGVGSALLAVAIGLLDPNRVRAELYPYDQAFTVGGLGISFGVCAAVLWLHDGALILNCHCRQFTPPTPSSMAMSALSALTDIVTTTVAATATAITTTAVMKTATTTTTTATATRRYSRRWWRLVLIWAIFGPPFGAHQLHLGQPLAALKRCALAAAAMLFILLGRYSTLSGGFGGALAIGLVFLLGAFANWVREGMQILRGRLGGKGFAPERRFWLILLTSLSGGLFGAHRLLLDRPRSAALFTLAHAAAIAAAVPAWHLSHNAAARGVSLCVSASLAVAIAVGVARDLCQLLRGAPTPPTHP